MLPNGPFAYIFTRANNPCMMRMVADATSLKSEAVDLGLEIRYGEHLYSLGSRNVGNPSRVPHNLAFSDLCSTALNPTLFESLSDVKAGEIPNSYPRQLRLSPPQQKSNSCWSHL